MAMPQKDRTSVGSAAAGGGGSLPRDLGMFRWTTGLLRERSPASLSWDFSRTAGSSTNAKPEPSQRTC
jgi:hypothetical protein